MSAAVVDAIEAGVEALGQDLPAGAGEKLARLLGTLEHWNARVNLSSIRSVDAMVAAHVLDSLSVRGLLEGARVIDVGTGAGFPGLPLAIAEPSRAFELLDSNGRKVAFVRHAIGELGLPNATAVQCRVENYEAREPFDTVVVRAVAALAELVELAGHLVSDNGILLALKGQYPADELRHFTQSGTPSGWDCNVTELTVPGLETHARHAVALRRTG